MGSILADVSDEAEEVTSYHVNALHSAFYESAMNGIMLKFFLVCVCVCVCV